MDGIAFGRPWLHAPGDRPPLELPPRKRARLTYDTDEGDDESDNDADWNEDDGDGDEDERATTSSVGDATGDSSQNEDNSEELLSELKLLKQDRKDISEHSSEDGESGEAVDNGDIGFGLLPTLDCMAALRLAFPAVAASRIDRELRRQGYDIRDAYDELASTFQATLSFDQMMDSVVNGTRRVPGTPHFSEMESLPPTTPTRPLIQEIESDDQSDIEPDSEDDTSSSGSSDESEESPTELNSLAMSRNSKPSISFGAEASDESDSGSEFASDSVSDSSSDSSSDSDSSDSSGAESNIPNGASVGKAPDDSSSSVSDSSSDLSSCDESDSPPEEASKPSKKAKKVVDQPLAPKSDLAPARLTKTQKRNARRKRAKQMKPEQEKEGTGVTTSSPAVNDDLLLRKAALLEALNTGTPQDEEASMEQITPAGNKADHPSGRQANRVDATPASAQTNGISPDPPRRMRVNLGAGRRLVFGALGLKNPKSKADEDKLRENLMKDVRPHTNKRLVEEVEEPTSVADLEMEDESWREKINYRAVECCYDGAELSEPPFPFVQRWDPQQQYNAVRKRKRQSEQSFYDGYEESGEQDTLGETEQEGSRKKAKGKTKSSVEMGDGFSMASNGGLSNDAATRGSPATDADDLPTLPQDVSLLPVLDIADAKPGMVITWKQLSMSKATNWQPQITLATGLIINGDGTNVNVVLAKRDREVSDKMYDEHTGKRIYEKFEAPASEDEDDDEEDDGHRSLSWNELMEPRIVQSEPPTAFMDGFHNGFEKPENMEVSEHGESNAVEPELDTQTLRAEVQHEVAQIANGHDQDSASIHSVQRPHHFDLPMLADDGLMSVASDSWETSKAANPDEGRTRRHKEKLTASQSGLLDTTDQREETAADKVAVPKPLTGKQAVDGPTTRAAGAVAANAHEEIEEAVIPSSLQSDNLVDVNAPQEPDSMPPVYEELIPETLPRGMTSTAAEQDWIANGAASGSSSPFPSLDEIFQTASTSREPPQSAPTTRAEINKHVDEEYEEAMRLLDNGEVSDASADGRQKLFPNATQPTRTTLAVELPKGAPEPRSSPRQKRREFKGVKKFALPAGSQVISLNSSPPPREDDGMDGEDETYTPTRNRRRSQQAGGSQKGNKGKGPATRTRRGSSLRQSESESVDGGGSQRAKLRRRSSGKQ